MNMDGRVVLVSGASSGIGAATALALAEVGAHVHGIDVNARGLGDQQDEMDRAGFAASHSVVDVSDEDAVQRAIHEVLHAHGRLDAVVASHGINSVDDLSIQDVSSDLLRKIIDVNLFGVAFLAKHSVDALKDSGHGVFIAVTSIAALMGPSGPAYAASKGGIKALVRAMAYDLAPDNVRCLTLSPGAIESQMHHAGLKKRGIEKMVMPPGSLTRVGEPRDVATVIRFLVSDEASYMTSSDVTVDGGLTPF